MTLTQFMLLMHRLSRDHGKKVFTLKEIAAFSHESRPATAMTLVRALKKGLLGRVGNLWFNRIDPASLMEIAFSLVSPSYLSFESALFHHGVISQSPRGALTLATTRGSRLVETPLGNIRVTHLKPSLFFGFDADRIASPEKAWLDFLYIRRRKDLGSIPMEEIDRTALNQKEIRRLSRVMQLQRVPKPQNQSF